MKVYRTPVAEVDVRDGSPIVVISDPWTGGCKRYRVFNRQSRVQMSFCIGYLSDKDLIARECFKLVDTLGAEWDSFAT